MEPKTYRLTSMELPSLEMPQVEGEPLTVKQAINNLLMHEGHGLEAKWVLSSPDEDVSYLVVEYNDQEWLFKELTKTVARTLRLEWGTPCVLLCWPIEPSHDFGLLGIGYNKSARVYKFSNEFLGWTSETYQQVIDNSKQ